MKNYLSTLILLAVLIVVAFVLSQLSVDDEREPSLLGANITYTEGSVEYKAPDGEWMRASEGANLFEGYLVEVVGEGKAIIALDDGSAIRLNSDSLAVLESMNPGDIVVTNNQGEIYSRITEGERLFTVKVGEDSYQAMGTAYNSINKEKKKGVEVYEGKVKVKKQEGEVLVEKGEKYYSLNEDHPETVGIKATITAKEMEQNAFVSWNKEQDEGKEEHQEEEQNQNQNQEKQPDPAPASTGIKLYATAVGDGIKFSWEVNGVDVSNGFKLVKSKTANPVYPGDTYKFLDSKNSSYTWSIKDGNTYNFRICQYLGGKCGVYSNNVSVTAPEKTAATSGSVTSIYVKSLGDAKISWSAKGYSEKGFKVVWSKTSKPTYPCREGDKYHYYSSPDESNDILTAFDGVGTYYVRVCEYLGGKCGVYSNQIQIEL